MGFFSKGALPNAALLRNDEPRNAQPNLRPSPYVAIRQPIVFLAGFVPRITRMGTDFVFRDPRNPRSISFVALPR
jgi:hypothetical protein